MGEKLNYSLIVLINLQNSMKIPSKDYKIPVKFHLVRQNSGETINGYTYWFYNISLMYCYTLVAKTRKEARNNILGKFINARFYR